MKFWMLSAAVSLSVCFLTLMAAQLASRLLKPAIARRLRAAVPENAADLLFAIQIYPVILAAIAGAGLALPAFLRFEPRITGEGVGVRLWIFSALAIVVVILMGARAASLFLATRKIERQWLGKARRLDTTAAGTRVPLFVVDEISTLLAVTGVLRPKIFVSSQVLKTLSREEFGAALAHELAHIACFDTLKRGILIVTRAPRWIAGTGMDLATWERASEISADNRAIRRGASPLDLSAALIKIARLKRAPVLSNMAASCLIPDLADSSLEERILRLEASLRQSSCQEPAGNHPRQFLSLLLISPLAICAFSAYAGLPLIHDLLEVLVRGSV